uniref:Uncharacterized protein n=1 Tax=Anguilla anguilla TaxID=7936 RepID=A0A0E9QBW1_ANGAN
MLYARNGSLSTSVVKKLPG